MNTSAHKIIFFKAILAIITCLFLGFAALPAYAQDNWNANEDASSTKEKMIERYQQLVDRSPEESYAFKQMIKTAGKGSDYDKLIKTYKNKVARDPKNFNLHMILGHLYKNGNDLAKAADQYKMAASIKETPLVFEALGAADEENKNYQDAIQYYEKALTQSKDKEQKERILRSLASIELHRRHLPEAKNYLTQLTALDPNSIFLRRELAQLLTQNKLYPEALEQLQAAEKLAGNNEQTKIQVQLEMGDIYSQLRQDDKALETYQKIASKVSPQHWVQREIFLRTVEIYRKKGSVEPLLNEYAAKWKSPSYDQALMLADLYDEVGKTDKALDLLKMAVKSQPSNPDAHERYIAELQAQGNFDETIKAHENRIKAIPKNEDYRIELAELLYKNNRKKEAIAVLDKAKKDFQSDSDAMLRLADKYYEWNQPDKALEIQTSISKKNPNDIDVIEMLGETYYMAGRKNEAIRTWKTILNTKNDKKENISQLARIYAEHSMFNEADELYRQILSSSPNDCTTMRSLADISERRRDYNAALEQWSAIGKRCRENALQREAMTRTVRIYQSQGILSKKLNEFEQNFSNSPDNLQDGFFLANAFMTAGDPEGAIRVLEKLHESHPQNEDVLFTLQQAYETNHQTEKAAQTLKNIVDQKGSQQYEAMIALADLYANDGDLKQAEHWMLEALQLNANDANANDKLSDIYRKLKNYDKAAYYSETAFDIDATNYERAFKLATIYSLLGKDEDADKLYVQIILNANDPELILKAGNRAIDYHDYKGTLETLAQTLYPVRRKTKNADVYQTLLIRICDTMAQPYIMQLNSYISENPSAARFKLREIGAQFSAVIITALNGKDYSTQYRALQLAPYLAVTNALPRIAELVNNSNKEIQILAALTVATFQSPQAVIYLQKWLGTQYDRRVREIAVWGLGLIPAPAAWNALNTAAEIHFDSLRALAVIGLARQHQNAPKIRELLKNDASPLVRTAAAFGAAYLKDSASADDVLSFLRSATSPQHALIWAARQFDTPENAPSLPYLYQHLWSKDVPAREFVARLLHSGQTPADLKEPTAWENNSEFIYLSENASSVFQTAFNVSGLLDNLVEQHLGKAETPSSLITNGTAFANAVKAGLKTGSDNDKRLILKDICTQQSAIQPLAQPDNAALKQLIDEIKPDIKSIIQSSDQSLQLYALQCFVPQDSSDIDLLIRIFDKTSQPAVRVQAATLLARSDHEKAIEALVTSAGKDDAVVKAAAIDALAERKDPKLRDLFLGAIRDDHQIVALSAIRALAALNNPEDNVFFINEFGLRHSTAIQYAILEILAERNLFSEMAKLKPNDPNVQLRLDETLSKG